MENKNMNKKQPKRLAWHETLMLHEIVMSSSSNLMMFKNMLGKVEDSRLHKLYQEAIQGTESNLKELIPFYSYEPAPVRGSMGGGDDESSFYAGALLGTVKCAVKDYAATILETATLQLRQTLIKQLNTLIELHYKIFCYMYENGYYPAYDLEQLRENDVKVAQMALQKN